MNTKETLREEWVKKNWKSIEEMVEYGYITKDFCKSLDSLCILGSELKDLIKTVEGMRIIPDILPHGSPYLSGRNEALDDIIRVMKERL